MNRAKVNTSQTYRSVHRPPFFTACRLTKAAWSLELGVAKLSSIPSSMIELCWEWGLIAGRSVVDGQ